MASFPEYMKNGLITSAYNVISKSALVGMGDIVSENALAWYESHPKTLQASELISRLQDDVMTYQVNSPYFIKCWYFAGSYKLNFMKFNITLMQHSELHLYEA